MQAYTQWIIILLPSYIQNNTTVIILPALFRGVYMFGLSDIVFCVI